MPAQCALTGVYGHKVVKRSKSMHGTITHLKANLVKKNGGDLNTLLGGQYFAPNKSIKITARALRTIKNKFAKAV